MAKCEYRNVTYQAEHAVLQPRLRRIGQLRHHRGVHKRIALDPKLLQESLVVAGASAICTW